jgi:hypothetical protein
MFSNENGLALRLKKSFCPLCIGSGVAGNSSTGTCNRMKRMSDVSIIHQQCSSFMKYVQGG